VVFFVSRCPLGDYRVRQARHVRGTSFSHVLHMFARSFFRHLSTPANGEKCLVCKRNCSQDEQIHTLLRICGLSQSIL